MTSLPIYWNNGANLDSMLVEGQPKHWVRTQLEKEFALVPLDTLAAVDSAEPSATLNEVGLLLLAQPRALSPADFAALDRWVRDGGRVLIFADPMLTEHSEFGFGDKRRPQDIAMLSPILARWGLAQFYDEDQNAAKQSVVVYGTNLPIRKAGRFELEAGGLAECDLLAEHVVAACKVGDGRAVLVSDAAMIEGESNTEINGEALDLLIRKALIRAPEGNF